MSVNMDEDAKEWLKQKHIKTPSGKSIQLEKSHRYQLLKLLFRSNKYSEDFKVELMQKEKAINFSDMDLLEELGCLASLQKDEDKMKVFLTYCGLAYIPDNGKFTPNPDPNKFNVKQLEASAKHFYNLDNLRQTERFGDLFFQVIEHVFETYSRDYAQNFFTYLCPTFLRRETDLEKYKRLFEKHKSSANTNFVNLISNEIDLFEQIRI